MEREDFLRQLSAYPVVRGRDHQRKPGGRTELPARTVMCHLSPIHKRIPHTQHTHTHTHTHMCVHTHTHTRTTQKALTLHAQQVEAFAGSTPPGPAAYALCLCVESPVEISVRSRRERRQGGRSGRVLASAGGAPEVTFTPGEDVYTAKFSSALQRGLLLCRARYDDDKAVRVLEVTAHCGTRRTCTLAHNSHTNTWTHSGV